jgi:prepilin-type N-terminal cleavage/methylation domain-containing protein
MKREQGFSLVEVLCATLILGVGLVGISQAVTLSLLMSKDSEQQSVAALLAAGRMETLRAEGTVIEGEEEGTFGEDFPLYGWRQTITSTATEGLYEVMVAVEFGRQNSYAIRTLLFKKPYVPAYEASGHGAKAQAFDERERRQELRQGGRK